MVPYRPLCGLSGYNPIYESKNATFPVISEKNSIFAS